MFFLFLNSSSSPNMSSLFLLSIFITISVMITAAAQYSSLCRSTCGPILITYPLGIDPGCGSPRFRNLLSCDHDDDHPSSSNLLLLRTPSGSYPVHSISYSVADPHLIISDPSMWSCSHFSNINPTISIPPFFLDTSTPLSLSTKTEFLFFNCSPDSVIVRPKPNFCTRFPDRCDSACDSAAYLCRNLPGCPHKLLHTNTTCCSYYPTASESVRMMLRHCTGGYTSLHWRSTTVAVGANNVVDNVPAPYDEVAEYGIRVDFEIPVTTRCQQCRERGGGGVCGFDTESRSFLCLCDHGINVTTYCGDDHGTGHKTSVGIIAGTTTVASFAGLAGIGSLVWYFRRMRTNRVMCGVQSNENRLF